MPSASSGNPLQFQTQSDEIVEATCRPRAFGEPRARALEAPEVGPEQLLEPLRLRTSSGGGKLDGVADGGRFQALPAGVKELRSVQVVCLGRRGDVRD